MQTLLFIAVFLLTFSVVFTLLIPNRFEKYQRDYVNEVKQAIDNATSGNVTLEVTKLKNEYKFDAIIFETETVIYTSNGLYEIESANKIYSEGFIYKGSYESNGYLVWLIVYNSELSEFVNQTLLQNLIILVLQTVIMLLVLYMIIIKAIRPLGRLAQIIVKLKKGNKVIKYNDDLDEISAELVKISNQLKLKLYYSKKEEQEFERRFTKQSELVYEQKNYLSNVLHDVKSTFATIKYSSKFLDEVTDLQGRNKQAINSIEKSSDCALTFITSSLNNVINNDYEIYIAKSDTYIKSTIENYFEYNYMLLLEKNLEVEIIGVEQKLNVNIIKFDQVINNILSNMIKYSKNRSKLVIEIGTETCKFLNEIGNHEVEYSNSYGINAIYELCNSIDFGYQFKMGQTHAISILTYAGDNHD